MRRYAGAAALLGWFGLALQFWLMLHNPSPVAVPMRIGSFFSYFTILSNILVALVLTAAALGGRGPLTRPLVRAAAMLFIAATGLIYTIILRSLYNQQGWDAVANAVVHYIMPLAYLTWWLWGVPHRRLTYAQVPALVAFPLVYGVYTLLRGLATGWYPYPFFNLGTLGIERTLVNMAGLIGVFALLAAGVVTIDRRLPR